MIEKVSFSTKSVSPIRAVALAPSESNSSIGTALKIKPATSIGTFKLKLSVNFQMKEFFFSP